MGLIRSIAQQSIWQHNLNATPVFGSPGTTLTANSTIHTKATTFTELIASTTYDTYGFWLYPTGTFASATSTCMLLDIAIGAASSEVVIAADINIGYRGTGAAGTQDGIYFPLFIPKGSRISGRTQALISSDTCVIGIWLNQGIQNTGPIFTGCDVYGTNLAASRGTLHTPGATGAESADASIGGTTSRAYGAVSLELGMGSLTNASGRAYHWELTIGGVTIAEWWSATSSAEFLSGLFPMEPFYVGIPSGTQLQVQAESSGTAQQQDVQFRCFY